MGSISKLAWSHSPTDSSAKRNNAEIFSRNEEMLNIVCPLEDGYVQTTKWMYV